MLASKKPSIYLIKLDNKHSGGSMKKSTTIIYVLFISISLFNIQNVFSQNTENIITERNLRNAILGSAWFSESDLEILDLNNDDDINISDLIYYLFNQKDYISFIGDHVGTFWRESGDFFKNQSSSFGQIPFCLRIVNDSPLEGYIDNQSDSDNNSNSYYSLYFSKQKIPVTFLTPDADNDLKFEIVFHTSAPNLSRTSELERKMVFSGKLSDDNSQMLSGKFEEQISGFKDNNGEDIPINIIGGFMIIFNDTTQELDH